MEADELVTSPEEEEPKRLSGAYRTSWGNTWFSSVTVKGRRMYLGTFDTPEEAHNAYIVTRTALKHPRDTAES